MKEVTFMGFLFYCYCLPSSNFEGFSSFEISVLKRRPILLSLFTLNCNSYFLMQVV